MTLSNEELVNKMFSSFKEIVDVDSLGNSILQPQKFARFVKIMQHRTSILNEARFVEMDAQQVDIDRIGFSGRVLRSGGERDGDKQKDNTLSEGDYAKPNTYTNNLVARELQAIASLKDRALRRNLEKGRFEDTLIDLFGEAAGRDLEEWALLANEDLSHSEFDLLSLTNGWIEKAGNAVYGNYEDADIANETALAETVSAGSKQITVTETEGSEFPVGTFIRIRGRVAEQEYFEVVNQDGDVLTLDEATEFEHTSGTEVAEIKAKPDFNPKHPDYPDNMFNVALQAMPKQYLRAHNEWRYWLPWDEYDGYRDYLRKSRQTSLGDSSQTGTSELMFKGIPTRYAPVLENSPAYDADKNTYGDVGLLGHPDNMVWGVFHEVTVEPDRVPRDKRTDFVLTFEGDAHYEDENATVAIYKDMPKPASA